MDFTVAFSYIGISGLIVLLLSEFITQGKIGFFTLLVLAFISVQTRMMMFANGYLQQIPVAGGFLFFTTGFAIGPLMFICALRAADSSRQDSLRLHLHFLPAGLVLAVELLLVTAGRHNLAGYYELTFIHQEFTILTAAALGVFIHICVYIGYIVYSTIRDLEKLKLERNYLIMLLLIYAVLCLGGCLCTSGLILNENGVFTAGLGALALSGFLAIFGNLKYPEFFLRLAQQNVRYSTISLSNINRDKVIELIEKVIVENEEFKNSNLRIGPLSQRLGLHRNQVSRIINEHYGCTFNQFVNRYRLEDAKHALATTKDKVLHIAFESGFNSASAFNAIFRKSTGLSPMEYRRQSQKKNGFGKFLPKSGIRELRDLEQDLHPFNSQLKDRN